MIYVDEKTMTHLKEQRLEYARKIVNRRDVETTGRFKAIDDVITWIESQERFGESLEVKK